jgi:hypothetical protein
MQVVCVRARMCSSGDVVTIIRVHQFLEHWHLINHALPVKPPSVAPPARPSLIEPPRSVRSILGTADAPAQAA